MVDKTNLSRRTLFPLAGLASLGSIAPLAYPDIDPATWGLRVSLRYSYGKWVVAIPDFDEMDIDQSKQGKEWGLAGWVPTGQPPLFKHVTLEDYLKQVEEICGIKRSV
jgi:hypothetical protein